MRSPTRIGNANWNYSSFGLKSSTTAPKPKFDAATVQKAVESQIEAEATTWETDGTLFVVEINFKPNQSSFNISDYNHDFAKALEIAETNAGALVVVEGHSDPLAILKAEKALRDGKPTKTRPEINQMRQKVKSLSLARAQAVRSSFLTYCKQQDIVIDESQFLPIGLGVKAPKYNPPRTEAEWHANRRVVFRIKQVEAELEAFSPLN